MISKRMALLATLACSISQARAGYSAGIVGNVAAYWGQNSFGQVDSQDRLSIYCANTALNIIPLAFLSSITNPTTVNFANAGDKCTTFPGTTLLSCPEIEEDIGICQSQYNKTILLSIGGATYTEGGFSSPSAAEKWADTVWAMFGPEQRNSSVNRPFGTAVIDGFDFDFESVTQNMAPFGKRLRSNMDAETARVGKKFYLSAAPQCVYPDAADHEMLNGTVYFDFIMIQFYNNACGAINFVPSATKQNAFNLDIWDSWAKTVSLNPDVKLLLGLPANTAGGGGYVSGSQLSAVLAFSKQYSSFSGVMLWDVSQLYRNAGFLDAVVSALGSGMPVTTTTTTTMTSTSNSATTSTSTWTTTTRDSGTITTTTITTTITATRSSSSTPTASLVPQWGQCGGEGYKGPTQCQPPFTCVTHSSWWAQCR